MTKELHFSIVAGMACMVLLLLALASGCSRPPNGGVPIYLLVDSATVVNDGIAGSTSNLIPDVWAETGSHNLGAYQTPVRIPILAQGDVSVLLSGGIYDNGIISSRASYPFYRPDTFTIHGAVAGQVYTHHPAYHYFANTQNGLIESFDNSNAFTNMSAQNSVVYEGQRSGMIDMHSADTATLAIQASGKTITTNGRDAYVEMNYKMSDSTTILCDVGVAATGATGTTNYYTLITLTPTTKWTKIYLNFSYWLGSNLGSNFQVYFVTYKDPGRTGQMYFDNVKLLYFQ